MPKNTGSCNAGIKKILHNVIFIDIKESYFFIFEI